MGFGKFSNFGKRFLKKPWKNYCLAPTLYLWFLILFSSWLIYYITVSLYCFLYLITVSLYCFLYLITVFSFFSLSRSVFSFCVNVFNSFLITWSHANRCDDTRIKVYQSSFVFVLFLLLIEKRCLKTTQLDTMYIYIWSNKAELIKRST